MRWLTLYLRSRRAPMALVLAGVLMAGLWSLWLVFSESRGVDLQMVVLTVLILVAAVTATLGGPDDALEKTAAIVWPPRRIAHLLVAFLIIAGLLLVTLATGARFGPVWLVVRDVGGLVGLTALGAATLGTARAWFVPLGWTLAAVMFPQSEPGIARVLTWQTQPPSGTAAAVTAGLLALGGLIAYAVAGPVPRSPAEAGQQ
ncbi:MAG: hypothetical protein ABW000_23990 [Actinoplanes sp.]